MSFNEWHRVSIKDVFELIPGFAFKSKDFSENGIPVIKIKNVKALRLLDRDFSYIDPKYLETKSRFTTKKGDLLISMTGNRIEGSMSSWVGKVCRINSDKKYLINQRVGILRLSNESYSDKFFLYLLGSEEIQKKLISIATSSGGQANISPDQIKSLEFSIPCFEEQNVIAHILSTLDEKIEVNNRINKTLEDIAQTIYKQWFVEFEFPNEDGETYKSSGGEMVESELGMIPKGWQVGKFEDLVTIKYGKDHKKLEDGNIPVFGSGGIMRFVDTSLYSLESVLIPRKGTLNNVMYINEPFWSVDTMFYTQMNFPNIAKYIYFFIRDKDLLSMNSGSAVPSMTTEILNRLPLVVSPLTMIQRFNNLLEPIFNLIDLNTKQIKELIKIRDSLLPKLLSGEIRAPLDEEGDAS